MLHVDTLIIGGAVMGSSIAYWLSENQDYDGTIVVVEPDPTYAHSSTALSEASIRHQFSQPVNIKLSIKETKPKKNFEFLLPARLIVLRYNSLNIFSFIILHDLILLFILYEIY